MAVNQLMSVGPMLPREPNAARERVSIGAPPQLPARKRFVKHCLLPRARENDGIVFASLLLFQVFWGEAARRHSPPEEIDSPTPSGSPCFPSTTSAPESPHLS